MGNSSVLDMKVGNLTKLMGKEGDLNLKLKYAPQEKQKLFHAASQEIVLYGGAVGGGKSAAVTVDVFMYAIQYPGVTCAIFRKTRLSAKKVFLNEGFEKFVPEYVWSWNERESCIQLVNGSRIFLLSMNDDREKAKYQGEEWQYLGIDEVTLFPEDYIKFMLTRCRSPRRVDGINPPRRVRFTANPGGPSHGYIKRLFIDRKYLPGEVPELYHFIPATIYDNKFLLHDAGYRQNLEGMGEQMKKRFLYGDWSIMDGIFLDRYDPRVCECNPFEIPRNWRRYRAMDYGWADETVIGWFAISPAGVHYMYREVTFTKTPVKTMAANIRDISKDSEGNPEEIIATYVDPSVYTSNAAADDPRERSIGLSFEQHGIKLIPANNDRKFGGMMIREYLSPTETIIDKDGTVDLRSSLVIFNTCKYTLDTVPFLVCDPAVPDDIEHGRGKKQKDHAYDMIRYYLTSRGNANSGFGEEFYNSFGREGAYDRKYGNLDSLEHLLDVYKKENNVKSVDDALDCIKKDKISMQKVREKLSFSMDSVYNTYKS